MASANEERLRRAYEAAGRGEVDVDPDVLDPGIVIRDRPEIPDPQTYHGYEGVREALQAGDDAFETLDLIPERFVEQGDTIVVVLRMQGRGRGSGVPVVDHIAHLWKLRDGRAYSLQVYSDPDEAIADARADGPSLGQPERPGLDPDPLER
jgi:ketosteroid isomerase-like protein